LMFITSSLMQLVITLSLSLTSDKGSIKTMYSNKDIILTKTLNQCEWEYREIYMRMEIKE